MPTTESKIAANIMLIKIHTFLNPKLDSLEYRTRAKGMVIR